MRTVTSTAYVASYSYYHDMTFETSRWNIPSPSVVDLVHTDTCTDAMESKRLGAIIEHRASRISE